MSSRIDDGFEAKFQAELTALPEPDRARIEAQLSEFNQTFTQGWNRLRSYQKDLLRRMGVKNNLDESSQFWLQLWAAARHAGISDDEFFETTPSMLCAVLEHKAAEIARQHRLIDTVAQNDLGPVADFVIAQLKATWAKAAAPEVYDFADDQQRTVALTKAQGGRTLQALAEEIGEHRTRLFRWCKDRLATDKTTRGLERIEAKLSKILATPK